jgi:hypothetical protein
MSTMTGVQEEVISRAMVFPMDAAVDRYAAENDLPIEVAREHERELKRYLALCALEPEVSYGMKGPVDDLWHTFITFTRDYAGFCDEVAGHFIHHVPNDSSNGHEDTSYGEMLEAYSATFGEAAPPEFWPQGEYSGSSSQCSPTHTQCAPAHTQCAPAHTQCAPAHTQCAN